jgi:serine/threonine-protein kinase
MGDDSLTPSEEGRVEAACQRFEDAWKAARSGGPRPRIEDYLAGASDRVRPCLLCHLIDLDLDHRRGAGEVPAEDDYLPRFVGLDAAWLRRALAGRTQAQAGPDESDDPPRFKPGDQIAGQRYRIIARLGRGGMGEVYSADDLKLREAVALKFLPPHLTDDPGWLARFHNEVRVARRVSHPNVCRVYDYGEEAGQPFLSMEYVPGQDLAALLRQVVRLPEPKGVEMARQLCLGLAAIHARDVLHRDLKPSNVLLDGRGQVHIADFGLAAHAQDVAAAAVREGTWAYQAPEQLAGTGVSDRSDLFALGLVLYELFTGERAFPAANPGELQRLYKAGAPTRPSRHVRNLDPAVERTILACLEMDTRARPASALAVARLLPGADPLADARAVGATLAPDVVAAAGKAGGLRPVAAGACLAATLTGLLLVALLSEATGAWPLDPEAPPEQLAADARVVLRELGYGQEFYQRTDSGRAYRAFGFARGAGAGQPYAFWYRASPVPLIADHIIPDRNWPGDLSEGIVSLDDPPVQAAGMTAVRLDVRGRLLEFRAVPPADAERQGAAADGRGLIQAWAPVFAKLSGCDLTGGFTEVSSASVPPVYADRRVAWKPAGGGAKEGVERVEAGFHQGRPVYFQVIPGPSESERTAGNRGAAAWAFTGGFITVEYFVVLAAAALAAWHNVRRGRGDGRGAWRLAAFVFAAEMLQGLLVASHVAGLAEVSLLSMRLARACGIAACVGVLYLALEPHVRRFWPEGLISWTRLLAGRWRDPLVGRDLLLGVLGGVAVRLVQELNVGVPSWLGLPSVRLLPPRDLPLLGGRKAAGQLLTDTVSALQIGLILVLSLLLLRVVLRSPRLAGGVYVVSSTLLFAPTSGHPSVSWLLTGMGAIIIVLVVLRLGLLAGVVLHFVLYVLIHFPVTANLEAWYAGSGLFALAAVAGLAVYGYFTSLAGRPFRRDPLTAD